jgi:hypothetical protein
MARERRLVPILGAIAVALVAFAWLDHVNPPPFMNDDGIRDQLLVRDCIELGRCHLIGASASLRGFSHGAVWIELLTAVRLLGGDIASQRTVVPALLALTVGTLFVVVWRWLRPSLALPAAVLLLAAMGVDVTPSMLIAPSAAAVPDSIVALALLCYGLSRQRRFLLVAAFALGVAINVHVGSLILVAPLLGIAVLGRPRAWREVLMSVGVLTATSVLTSSAALRANAIAVAGPGRLLPAVSGGLVVLLASAAFGARFRRWSWDARAAAVGLVLVVPFALASLWLVRWHGHHFSLIYLHPVLAPAAVLLAALLAAPFEIAGRRRAPWRWIPSAASAAAVALVALGVWHPPGVATAASLASASEATSWSLPHAASIADQATRRGWSFEDLVFHIQGNACRELLAGMAMTAPPPRAAPIARARQLQVVKAAHGAPPAVGEPHDVVELGPSSVAIVREIASWLRPDRLRVCLAPAGAPARCAAPAARPAEVFTPEQFLFITRSYPEIHRLDVPPPYVARYEIPLVPDAGERRDLILTDRTAPDAGWRFTGAEGLRIEGDLPAKRVRVHSETGAAGVLVIEKAFGPSSGNPDDLDMRYPPCMFEAPPGDALLALVER